MTHDEQLAAIHEAYNSLPEMVDGLRDVTKIIFNLCEVSERRHRKPTEVSLVQE